MTFTSDDLTAVVSTTVDAWTAGIDRDWTVRAGTVDWTCLATADHAVDCTLAPALLLASRRQDAYPEWGWGEMRMGDAATPERLIEALQAVSRIAIAVFDTTPPDVRAIIWRRPVPEARPPSDFVPRSGLELALHAHDVCAGLGIAFEPSADVAARLRDHVRGWPFWRPGVWPPMPETEDPWGDLLAGSGRARQS